MKKIKLKKISMNLPESTLKLLRQYVNSNKNSVVNVSDLIRKAIFEYLKTITEKAKNNA